MPMPRSLTWTTTSSSIRCALTPIHEPSDPYFAALEIKLMNTWLIASLSIQMTGKLGSMLTLSHSHFFDHTAARLDTGQDDFVDVENADSFGARSMAAKSRTLSTVD